MAEDKKVGGAYVEITADSTKAEKVMGNFFNWFTKTGEKATETAGKIGQVIKHMENLGKSGQKSTQSVADAYDKMNTQVAKTKQTAETVSKSLMNAANKGVAGYQTLTKGIKSDNAEISKDTKQKFDSMQVNVKKNYKDMLKDSKTFNAFLKTSTKASIDDLKKSFGDLENGFKTVAQAIVGLFKKPVDTIKNLPKKIATAVKKIPSFVSSGFSKAKELALSQINKIKDGFLSIPTHAKMAINRTKNFFVTGFNSLINTTAKVFSKIGNGMASLPTKAKEVGTRTKNFFVGSIKSIPTTASGIWSKVKSGIQSIPEKAGQAGATIKEKLSNGFQKVLAKAKQAFPGVKKEIQEGVDKPAEKGRLTIGKLAGAFGLVKIAGKAFDMVKGSVSGAIARIDTLNNSTRAFGNMGFKVKDVTKAMDALEEGITGLPTPMDSAVSSLQMIASSTDDLGKSQKIFNALNDAILGFGGSAETVENAVLQLSQGFSKGKLQGEEWNSMLNSNMGPVLSAIAKKMGITKDALKDGLSDGSISVEKFQDTLIELDKNGGGGLASLQKIAKDSTDGISTSIANAKTAITKGTAEIILAFSDLLQKATGKNLSTWISEFGIKARKALISVSEAIKKLDKPLKALFRIMKPLQPIILGVLAGLLGYSSVISVIAVITKLSKVFKALFAGLASNPLAIFVGVVAALSVALITAYNKSESFRKAVDNILTPLKNAYDSMKRLLEIDLGKKDYGAALQDVVGFFTSLPGIIETNIAPLLTQLKETGNKFIANLLGGMKESLPKLGNIAWQLLTFFGQAIVTNLPIIVSKGIQIVLKLARGIRDNLPKLVDTALTLVVKFGNFLAANFPKIIAKGMQLVTKLGSGIVRNIPHLLAIAIQLIGKLIGVFIKHLPDMLGLGVKIVGAIIKGLWEFAKGIGKFVTGFFKSLAAGFKEINWGKLGGNILDGILSGLTSGAKKVGKAVSSVGSKIKNGFKSFFGIHSPSKLMAAIAKFLPLGIAQGIEDEADKPVSVMDKLSNALTGATQLDATITPNIQTASVSQPQAPQADVQDDATQDTFVQDWNKNLADNEAVQQKQGTDWLLALLAGFDAVYTQMTGREKTLVEDSNKINTNNNSTMKKNGSDWLKNMLTGLNAIYPKIISREKNLVKDTNRNIRSNDKTMQNNGRTWLQRMLNGFNSLYKAFTSRVNKLGNDSVNNVRSKYKAFYNAGRHLMSGLRSGISSMGGALSTTLNGVANKMVKGLGKGVNGVIGGVNHVMKEVESKKRLGTWKVPQYAKGTQQGGHPEDGPAIVNDQKGSRFRELIQNPDGSMWMAKAKNAMVYLQKGARVFNANVSDRILKGQNAFNRIPKYKKGTDPEEDTEIFDIIESQSKFSKFINGRIDFKSITEPWQNMTRSATNIMNAQAWKLVEKEAEEMIGGSFDGAIWNKGPAAANGVYAYLIKIANQAIKKFGMSGVTSGYRPGDPYRHGSRQAVDIGFPASMNGSSKYFAPANWIFEHFPSQVAYVITQGKVRDRKGSSGTGVHNGWSRWPDNDHYDHLHIDGMWGKGDIGKQLGGKGGGNWKKQIRRAAAQMKTKVTASQVNGIYSMLMAESGGNQGIKQQIHDVNSTNGSGGAKGLLQFIQSTFNAYAVKGHKNIWSGYDQLLAFFNNSNWRNDYNPSGGWGPRGHRRFANGGLISERTFAEMGESGDEMVIPLTKPRRALELIIQSLQYLFSNGSSIVSRASSGLQQLTSNMSMNLGSIGMNGLTLDLGAIGGDSDLTEVILLMKEQNRLLKDIRAKDNNVYMDKKKVSKELAKPISDEQTRNNYLQSRNRKGVR